VNEIRLASSSAVRRALLEAAGLRVSVAPARVDEHAVREAMQADGARPREIADALAGLKAEKVAARHPEGLTLGCDQVLEFEGQALGKPDTPEAAGAMLRQMAGKPHLLHSAAVVVEGGQPVWRHVAVARMQMRALSARYIDAYVQRNWEQIRHSAGGYLIEAEGIRLFSGIGTDYHAILGLPLIQLLNWLALRGEIET
jgi:septum formation protein